ncbi:baseplate assembly protein [Methylobacterium planeticum]|uniref:Baseplate J protein n=1 Tax=Methylobacterium planeticum TaxID=2615211 RepID=A0A6N6MK70_9HYPH|nr:baseplate J/gp47 family protein [Methylobacterium planeticum]KAB1069260.1 baseplate J protein [Methylobacterium planeticum]
MTRFVAPNLAGLAPPPAIDPSTYQQVLDARLADLATRLTAAGLSDVAGVVLTLETEPLRIGQETDSYFELLIRQRINEAVRANLIATATAGDLDHLAATFYGVARLLVTPSDPSTGAAAGYENDDTFRARALLSLEARSTAGPEGAYVYQALETDRAAVLDAACYGEEDAALYADGSAVLAPEVLIVLLARDGDGTPSDALLATVAAQLNKEEVRPIGDKVTIESAAITPYAVEMVIRHAPGADPEPLRAEARTRVEAYVAARRRIGRVVQRLGIGAAAKITDVEEIELAEPVADIDPGSKGAGFCTSIVITAEVTEDSWR